MHWLLITITWFHYRYHQMNCHVGNIYAIYFRFQFASNRTPHTYVWCQMWASQVFFFSPFPSERCILIEFVCIDIRVTQIRERFRKLSPKYKLVFSSQRPSGMHFRLKNNFVFILPSTLKYYKINSASIVNNGM